jgi:hypothetical protein
MTPRIGPRLIIASTIGLLASSAVFAQCPRGPGFGPQAVQDVSEKFDKDGNGWLNADERKAAREYLAAQGSGRGGFGGRGFGRGGFGRGGAAVSGSPGPRVDAASVKPVPDSVPLYDPGTVRTIFFEFDSPDWEQELADFRNTDVEVPVSNRSIATSSPTDSRARTAYAGRYRAIRAAARASSTPATIPKPTSGCSRSGTGTTGGPGTRWSA